MIDPANGEGKITCEHPATGPFHPVARTIADAGDDLADEKFLEFVKRQEVDDIVSGYE